MRRHPILVAVVACLLTGPAWAGRYEKVIAARDSLAVVPDDHAKTAAVLERLRYEPGAFEVTLRLPGAGEDWDAVASFPSPKPSGRPGVDTVHLLWYAARDEGRRVVDAPAVLVVHTVHPQLLIAKMIARGLAAKGVHAFVVELPGYHGRQTDPPTDPRVAALTHATQGIADTRRALDAIRVIPHVASDDVAIAGPSLGGFVAAVAAGLDGAFGRVFLVMSGADCYGVLRDGRHDAAWVRMALERAGYKGEALRAMLEPVEPMNVAHRLPADRTWLVTARGDRVVPARYSDRLAEAIGLDDAHRVVIHGNHYTALVSLPRIVDLIALQIKGEAAVEPAAR